MDHLTSKLTSKSQAVIPQAVRRKLGLRPGDRVRYCMRGDHVFLEKIAEHAVDDPFVSFGEWASAEDDEAFADL